MKMAVLLFSLNFLNVCALLSSHSSLIKLPYTFLLPHGKLDILLCSRFKALFGGGSMSENLMEDFSSLVSVKLCLITAHKNNCQ